MRIKVVFLFLLFYNSSLPLNARNPAPRNSAYLSSGISSIKKPISTVFSLELSIDAFVSKKSAISFGIYSDYYYRHKKFQFDTNFVYALSYSTNTNPNMRSYFYRTTSLTANYFIGYKHWFKINKTKSIYIESRLGFEKELFEKRVHAHYFRDTSNVLHLGPYEHTDIEKFTGVIFFPDYLKPALRIGYEWKLGDHYSLATVIEVNHYEIHEDWSSISSYGLKCGVGISYSKR